MTDLLQKILDYITANPDTATAIAVGFLSLLSGALQLFGLTTASKFVGTITFDLGRLVRLLKFALSIASIRRAAKISAAMAKTMGPPLVLIAALSALTATQGCALFRGAVVAGQAACQSELVNAPDVIAEAKVRGVSVGQLVDAFCGLVDVAAIFAAEPKSGVARQAMSPRDQAVTLLRAKGELQ